MMSIEFAALPLNIKHSQLKIRASRAWPTSSDRIGDLAREIDADPSACFSAERKCESVRLSGNIRSVRLKYE